MPSGTPHETTSTRVLAQRLARRDLVVRAAALGLSTPALAALLAACAGDDDDDDGGAEADQQAPEATEPPDSGGESTESTPEGGTGEDETGATEDAGQTAEGGGEAQQGGTVSVSVLGDPTLNPFTQPGQLPTIFVMKNVFSGLTKYSFDDPSVPVPDLATEWSASDDGLEWTFKLREGVTWHDGEPFTADDVVFTLEGVLNPDVRARGRDAVRDVTEISAVDDLTVVITTSQPIASLPILLGYNMPMAPMHLLEGEDLNELADFVQNPVGTGPFVVDEQAPGDRITLRAFDDYYDGRPNIDTLIYKVLPDVNNIVAQLLSGELDIGWVEPTNLSAIEGQGAGDLNVYSALEPNTFYYALNHSRPPWDDVRVRKAFTMAVDRQLIVDQILLGKSILATTSHSPAFGEFYNEEIEPYPYDVDQAAALMEEAGFTKEDGKWTKDGQPLSFSIMVDQGNPTREQIALTGQQFLTDFGAEVSVDVEEWSVYIERGNSQPGDYDTRTSWRITAPDPDKTSEYHTDGANNHYMYSNPEVDRLLEEGRAELDHEKRVEIYHELQRVLYEDCVLCWLYYTQSIVAVNKRIQGYPENLPVRDAQLYMYQVSTS